MSGFVMTNPNPRHRRVGDCVIRAISKALDQSWVESYMGICLKGLEMADLPSSNAVWGAYLRDKGFTRHLAPEDREDGIYTVEDFAHAHLKGTYILGLDGHVVCVKDGDWLDSWNSGHEVPIFYWSKLQSS